MNKVCAIQINSRLHEVSKPVKEILEYLKEFGVDKSTMFDIRLSLEEALINAIKHGNSSKENLVVKISYSLSPSRFKVIIQDQGQGFDYKALPNPTKNENLLKTKGRGIYLIKYLMDELSFNKTGNRVTMVKYLPRGKNANQQNKTG